jgi:D-xylonolactonase
MSSTLETISTGHGLLEGPMWSPQHGLIVADAIVGGVHAYRPGQEPELVVPHRRGIGGMAMHENGAVIIGGRNLAMKRPASEGDDSTIVLLENDPANDIIGYNDLAVDAAGRIYIGSLAFVAATTREGKPGKLHVIDLDGSSRVVAEDVLLTNGLGFAPGGKLLYHSDSLRHAVYVYDVRENGDLENRRTFVTTSGGMPDGLVVDSAGTVWVAEPNSGRVIGYSPAGDKIGEVVIPVPMVTSMCFGGDDLRDLYIVSGSEGQDTDRGAGIYKIRVEVPGQAANKARVRG